MTALADVSLGGLSAAVCRICHSGENSLPYEQTSSSESEKKGWRGWLKKRKPVATTEPLISPCNCKGALGLFHASCLERWLVQSGRKHCEICLFRFRIRLVPGSLLSYIGSRCSDHEMCRQAFADRVPIVDLVCIVMACVVCGSAAVICVVGGVGALNNIRDMQASAAAVSPELEGSIECEMDSTRCLGYEPAAYDEAWCEMVGMFVLSVVISLFFLCYTSASITSHARFYGKWRVKHANVRMRDRDDDAEGGEEEEGEGEERRHESETFMERIRRIFESDEHFINDLDSEAEADRSPAQRRARAPLLPHRLVTISHLQATQAIIQEQASFYDETAYLPYPRGNAMEMRERETTGGRVETPSPVPPLPQLMVRAESEESEDEEVGVVMGVDERHLDGSPSGWGTHRTESRHFTREAGGRGAFQATSPLRSFRAEEKQEKMKKQEGGERGETPDTASPGVQEKTLDVKSDASSSSLLNQVTLDGAAAAAGAAVCWPVVGLGSPTSGVLASFRPPVAPSPNTKTTTMNKEQEQVSSSSSSPPSFSSSSTPSVRRHSNSRLVRLVPAKSPEVPPVVE